MKNIFFDKLIIQNFLSFGENPVELSISPGITFITGINKDVPDSKNGVGKSALILESFSFALYGKTFRKINNDKISNFKTNKPCIVQLFFRVNNDHYEIVRSLNPTKLLLYKNSQNFPNKEESNISRTVSETNKDIIDILGVSKEIFTNTLVMTNRNYIPFPDQDKTDKTKFVEGILSLEIFSKMYDSAKKSFNEISNKFGTKQTQVTDADSSLKNNITHFQNEITKKEDNIKKIENDISNLLNVQPIDNSLTINTKKEENEKFVIEYKEKEEKINKAKLGKSSIEGNTNGKIRANKSVIQIKQNEIKKLDSTKFECPTCNRPYDNCDDKSHIEKSKNELLNGIKELNDQIKEFELESKEKLDKLTIGISNGEKALKEINDKISSNKKLLIELENEQLIFAKSQERMKVLNETLTKEKKKENPFGKIVKENELKLEKLKEELKTLEFDYKIAEGVKFVTSPSGVKTSITKKVIEILNERLNYYLGRMSAPIKCEFDEFFEEKFIDVNGIEYTYGNLSGGEAKRVDFAMLLTFRDIRRLQSNIAINITVLDEIMDNGIDIVGLTSMIDLLNDMVEKTGESVYIITHKSEGIEEQYPTIRLEKENGISKIV